MFSTSSALSLSSAYEFQKDKCHNTALCIFNGSLNNPARTNIKGESTHCITELRSCCCNLHSDIPLFSWMSYHPCLCNFTYIVSSAFMHYIDVTYRGPSEEISKTIMQWQQTQLLWKQSWPKSKKRQWPMRESNSPSQRLKDCHFALGLPHPPIRPLALFVVAFL